MGKLFAYHSEDKALPHELFVMYRQRSRLTQNQLAARLGLKSDRMIQKWESGYTLPTAPRLQSLLQIYLMAEVFVAGKEQEEARQLWTRVKNMFDQISATFESYPIFDEGWFKALLQDDKGEEKSGLDAKTRGTVLTSNLPLPLNRFIGREREIAEVKRLFELDSLSPRDASHLVSLVGVGGVGKTRLALQIASQLLGQFKDGVWLVELAPLFETSLLTSLIAARLGVKEEPGKAIFDTLLSYLRSKQILLILDNCEHLVAEVAQISEALLKVCP
jgi:transcriptional regulator with XRE-family HTH domain